MVCLIPKEVTIIFYYSWLKMTEKAITSNNVKAILANDHYLYVTVWYNNATVG